MNSKNAMLFIFITIVIDATGLGIIIPTLPSLIAETSDIEFGESKMYAGYIAMVYAVMQFIFAPIVGGLSDRYGRRPVLLLSLFGLALDYLIMFYAPSLFWLVIGRCISGMFGASYSTATAYIADISTDETRTRNFGMVGAAFGVGFIIGPAIGGILGDVGIRIPFLFAAGLSALNFIYGVFVLKETLAPENRRQFSFKRSNPIGSFIQIVKYKELANMFIVIFMYHLAGTAIQHTWVYLTKERFAWSELDIGISLAIVGVCVAVVQGGLAGVLSKKWGDVKTAYIGLGMFVFAVLGIGFANQGWMLYALMLPYAFTGLAGPTMHAIMSKNTSASEQGELQGSITSIISLSEIVGPVMMMALMSWTTVGLAEEDKIYGSSYFAAAVIVLFGLFFFHRAVRKAV